MYSGHKEIHSCGDYTHLVRTLSWLFLRRVLLCTSVFMKFFLCGGVQGLTTLPSRQSNGSLSVPTLGIIAVVSLSIYCSTLLTRGQREQPTFPLCLSRAENSSKPTACVFTRLTRTYSLPMKVMLQLLYFQDEKASELTNTAGQGLEPRQSGFKVPVVLTAPISHLCAC